MIGNLMQDVRYAVRTFTKQPGFVAVAVLTLALGIGANSAIFSVIYGVLLKPLALKEPERVVKLWESMANGFQGSVSFPNLKDWREQNSLFSQLAAFQFANVSLQAGDSPERVRAATVTAEFFEVMGTPPQLGRVIAAGEDQAGRARVVVLSHQLWQRSFAGDPGIIGRDIQLGGETFSVIGVMPASFRFPARTTELWIPLVILPQQAASRGNHAWLVIGRLKDGVTLSQAQGQMNVIARRIEEQYPDQQTGRGVLLIQLQEETVRNIRPALLMLLAAVGFVLLIACTNVANLLLARAAVRGREMAIRTALGAGRVRIIRQLLTESLILSACGGLFGLLFAYLGLNALLKLATGILPRAHEVTLDNRVLIFTMLLSLLTGIIFGLAPALHTSKIDLQSSLKEGGAAAGTQQRTWLRSLLVVFEVAAALILLIGASLLIKSFARLQQTDSGLQTENVLTMGLTLPNAKYPTAQASNTFHRQLLERVSGLPGVISTGIISKLPLQDFGYNGTVNIEGQPPLPAGQTIFVEYRAVSADYFRTFGIPLIAGRFVNERDQAGTAPVVVVNQTFVKQLLNDQDALGKFVVLDNTKYQIVGVVGDVRQSGLTRTARPEMFWHYPQVPYTDLRSSVSLVARTATEPTSVVAAIRREVQAIDPGQPIHNVKTMNEVVADSVADRRLNMLLLGVFAAVALVLALVGVYSVMSYQVAQHTREIGIRIALGAQTRDVLKLVLGQGLLLTLAGIAIGIGGAFALTRLMENLLYGVQATDTLVFSTVPLLLILIALLACCIPARRAARVDPLIALRYE
jgi:putative ABC transport system permease protein